MKKKQNIRKAKSVKCSRHNSIVIMLILISFRFIFWTTKKIYLYTQKNAFLVIGILTSTISFIFFSFNALFLQIETNRDVFTQTKDKTTSNKEKSIILSPKEKKSQTNNRIVPSSTSNDSLKNSPSNSLSESAFEVRRKLDKLRLYNDPLYRVDEQKTHSVIKSWKQKITSGEKNTTLPKHETDEIATLIKRSEIEMGKDLFHSKTDISKSQNADVLRVQKALRVFGNQEVTTTGIKDQKTTAALKQFQKIFHLPITGKIDQEVLKKMHEIGLFN
ncbi:peptidoglycan-binding protein [Bartonella sp. CB189]|uniref:peptidoglycan-binding protein n=1 Tax=Bartonella sp. CB189 TaxID=3112254 RepID=UPI002F96278B